MERAEGAEAENARLRRGLEVYANTDDHYAKAVLAGYDPDLRISGGEPDGEVKC